MLAALSTGAKSARQCFTIASLFRFSRLHHNENCQHWKLVKGLSRLRVLHTAAVTSYSLCYVHCALNKWFRNIHLSHRYVHEWPCEVLAIICTGEILENNHKICHISSLYLRKTRVFRNTHFIGRLYGSIPIQRPLWNPGKSFSFSP